MSPELSPLDAPNAGASAGTAGPPPPELVALALAQLSEGVIVTDAEGRIRYVNAAAERLHGVARLGVGVEEYASAYRIFTEDGRPYPSAELPLARAVLRGDAVVDARWRIRRPDGTEVLAVGSARPLIAAGGERRGAVLTLRDDAARADVESTERGAAQILERIADAHVAFDRDFRYVAVNAAAERAFGRPREEILGRTLLEAFPSAAGSESERQYRRVAAEGVEVHFTEHFVGDGLDIHVEVDAYPTDGGGVAVFFRDVTAEKEAADALREMNAALGVQNAELQEQGLEVELANQQLQDQAAELEAANEELRTTSEELADRTVAAERAAAALVESEAQLEAVLHQLPVGVIIAEAPSGRLLMANAQSEEIWRRATHAAGAVAEYRAYAGFHPEDGRPYAPEEWPLARAALRGETVKGELIDFRRGDGTMGTMRVSATPVGDDSGRVATAVVVFEDITPQRDAEAAERRARLAAERAAERMRRLQELTAALGRARTVEDVAEVVVAQAVAATGAKTAMFLAWAPGADEAVIVRQSGFTAEVLERYRHMPLTTPGLGAESLRTGEPVWVTGEGDDTLAARYPALAALWESFQLSAVATVPLAAAGQLVGAMSFTFAEPQPLLAEEREFFLALAGQAGQTLERARLLEAERAARAEAEAAQRRLAFLAEASARLAGSLDVEATLRTVAALAVPALADWCFVEVRGEDGKIRSAAVAHEDPAKVAFVSEILRRYPLDPEAPFGTGHVLRTGKPEVTPEIPDELLASIAQDAEHLALVRSVGMKSSLSVPLFAPDGRAAAVLSLVSAESGRRFGPADLAMAEEVARRASVALSSARLYAAEQAALQHAAGLQRVTAALSGTLTTQQAATLVMEQSVALLGAEGGVVLRTSEDGAMLEVIGAVGYPAGAVAQWQRFRVDERVPLAEAVRLRMPIFVESVAAWRERFGERALLRELSTERSWAALPLVAEGRVLGVMGLSFPREGPLSAEDRAFVTALAQQCAQAFERARLFEAERGARAEAEAANRAKSEFLATMSHELRTPLNAIGGYAQLLEMGLRGEVTPEQREDLERIQRSQRHLLSVINEVLNYARLEGGAVTYDLRPTLLADVVATVAPLVEPQRTAKRLTLDVRLPELAGRPPFYVLADRDKLQQVVLNLLSNAVKFTPEGGRVTVELLGERNARGMAELRVTDTGVGVPPDKLDAIFEPFVQVGRTLSSPGEGTGLGLAISRDLARGMGGDITAESRVGEGSTFTLTLVPA